MKITLRSCYYLLLVLSPIAGISQSTMEVVDYAGHDIWKGNPSMAVHGDYVYVLYTEENNKGRICRHSMSTGESVWSDDLFPTIAPHDVSHNDSAIAVDGDGYLHCWIGMHNREGMKYFRSNEPESFTSFTECGHEMPQPDLRRTYPWACTTTNGDVFVIFREARGGDNEYQDLFHWNNKTDTWKRTSLLGVKGDSAYMSAIYADSQNNLHIATAWADYHFHDNHFQRGSYVRYNVTEDKYYKADGTQIKSFPIDHRSSDADLFYENKKPWSEIEEIQTPRIAVNARNQPVIVYPQTEDDGGHWTYQLARWDGERWTSTTAYTKGTRYGRPLVTKAGNLVNVYATDISEKEIYSITSVDDGSNVHFSKLLAQSGYIFAKAAVNVNPTTDFFISRRHLFKVDYSDLVIGENVKPLPASAVREKAGFRGDGEYRLICKNGYKSQKQNLETGNVEQDTSADRDSQIWIIKERGNGYVQIINKETGLAMKVADPRTTRWGETWNVVAAELEDSDAFLWELRNAGYDYVHVISKMTSKSMVPEGPGGSTDVGASIVVKALRSDYNEYHWELLKQ